LRCGREIWRCRCRFIRGILHRWLRCSLRNRFIERLHILLGWSLFLDILPFLLSNRVRRIRVFASLNRFHYPHCMVFGELDFGGGFGVRGVPDLAQFEECSSGLKSICRLSAHKLGSGLHGYSGRNVLGNLIGAHGRIRTIKDLQRKLLNVGMCSHIIRYSIIIRILAFNLSPDRISIPIPSDRSSMRNVLVRAYQRGSWCTAWSRRLPCAGLFR